MRVKEKAPFGLHDDNKYDDDDDDDDDKMKTNKYNYTFIFSIHHINKNILIIKTDINIKCNS